MGMGPGSHLCTKPSSLGTEVRGLNTKGVQLVKKHLQKLQGVVVRTLSFPGSIMLHFHQGCEAVLPGKPSKYCVDSLPCYPSPWLGLPIPQRGTLPLAADAPPLMQRLPSVLPERPCRVSRVPLLMPLVWWLSVDPQFVACKD